MKEVKKLQKQEEKHRKEAERESQRSLLKYALRTQTILNLIDDNAKVTLQSGEGEDVVKLNESELNQLDEFYELVNPTRPGNERYVMRYYVMYLYLLSIYLFFLFSLCSSSLSPSFSLSLSSFPSLSLSPLSFRYDRSLSAASDHLMYLFERSTKEVAHTTCILPLPSTTAATILSIVSSLLISSSSCVLHYSSHSTCTSMHLRTCLLSL